MNKANLYLYQHPLFTCILLFCIGVVFGMCVVILIFETYRTVFYRKLYNFQYQMEAMYESEVEDEECEVEEEAKSTENVEEKKEVEEKPVEETEEKKEE